MDALEPCSALMEIARKKSVYSQFIQAYLGTERLTLEDGECFISLVMNKFHDINAKTNMLQYDINIVYN